MPASATENESTRDAAGFSPADAPALHVTPADFVRGGRLSLGFSVANDREAVLHVRLSSDRPWATVAPSEIALGVDERQPMIVTADLDAARQSVGDVGSTAANLTLTYQFLHPAAGKETPASGAATVSVRLPIAACPVCRRILDTNPADGLDMPELCPHCFERLRACPICGAANTWLVRRCIADPRHVIFEGPDWTSIGGGPGHSAARTGRVGQLIRRWSYPSVAPSSAEGALAWSAPVAAYGVVAAAAATSAGEAHLMAFDARKGSPIWDPFPLPDPVYPERGGSAIAGQRLITVTVDGVAIAVDILRGVRLWQTALNAHVYGAPVAARPEGPILIAAKNDSAGALFALDAETGETLWSAPLSGQADAAPAADDSLAFVHDDSGALTAIRLDDGVVAWQIYGSAGFDAAPLVSAGHVFSADVAGNARCVDLAGKVLWTSSLTDAPMMTTPASDGSLLYLPADDGLHLASAAGGKAIRRFGTRRPVRSSPIVLDSVALFGNTDGGIYIAHPTEGLERVYEIGTAGTQFVAAPAYHEGVLYIPATNGVLYALSPAAAPVTSGGAS